MRIASMELPENKNIVYFAKTHYRNNEKVFGIQRKDRRQHMYVLGKSGMGKSTLLSNMLLQDIKNGDGVCVVDPHGEMVEDLLGVIPKERLNDVVYFNPSDIEYHVGFNVLEVYDDRYKHLVASGIMGIFTKIWANVWSSRMEYILNNCILALIDTPGSTLLGIPRLLVDKDYRQKIVNNIKDPVVRTFWIHEYETWEDRYRKEAIAPIQNKVGQFLSSSITRNILGQTKSTINIPEIMDKQKIFLVNLSKGRVGEDNSALLGAMIITKLQLAAMERVKIEEHKRKDFYLYVDEFQNFVTDSFATILSEARKYRLNLTIAHQYVAQLETDSNTVVRDAVFGNVGTMIIGRVGAADAAFLETEFMPEFTPDDFVSLPNHHVYLKMLVNGMTTRPFSAKTLPSIVKMEKNRRVEEYITKRSRELYHRPRGVVEKEISSWSNNEELDSNVKIDSNGLGTDGKYHIPCSFDDCNHIAKVPFKPEAGRPVYCRDCISKIKSGDKKAIFKNNENNKPVLRKASTEGLAALGIEFKPEKETVSKKERTLHKKQPLKKDPLNKNRKPPTKQKTVPTQTSKRRDGSNIKDISKTLKKNESQEKIPKNMTNKSKKNYPKNTFKPAPRKRTDPDRDSLKTTLLDALKEVDFSNKKTNYGVDKKTPPEVKSKKNTISLKDLATRSVKEKVIDKEDKYAKLRKETESEPGKPRFDPTKQASNDKVSALRAALAKTKNNTQKEDKKTPNQEAKENQATKTSEQKEVPENILKKILAEDDE